MESPSGGDWEQPPPGRFNQLLRVGDRHVSGAGKVGSKQTSYEQSAGSSRQVFYCRRLKREQRYDRLSELNDRPASYVPEIRHRRECAGWLINNTSSSSSDTHQAKANLAGVLRCREHYGPLI